MTFQAIDEFPGYEISEDGVVRSWQGSKPRTIIPLWLKSQRWAVRLSKGGKRHLRCVANLVLETHVGPPCQGKGSFQNNADVIFVDDDPTNVSVANLRWRHA